MQHRKSRSGAILVLSAISLLMVMVVLHGLLRHVLESQFPAPGDALRLKETMTQFAALLLGAMMVILLGISLPFIMEELLLRQAISELHRTNVKKSELIAVAANELRSPLTVISGFSQLMRKRKLPGHLKGELALIEKEAQRIDTLMSSLREISGLDLASMSLDYAETDLTQFLHQCLPEFKQRCAEKRQKMVLKADSPGKMRLDRERLLQVLRILVDNAARFGPERSTVTMTVLRTSGLRVQVNDEGPSIPKEHQERIFQQFYQIESARHSGIGLGLAICKATVEAMGGHIWVESERKGATFSVSLPAP